MTDEDINVLTTWLIGLLEGCEQCRDEAQKWVSENGLNHVAEVADEE